MEEEDADTAFARRVLQVCARYAGDPVAGGTALFFGSVAGGSTVPTATAATLKRAYKPLVLRLHPDKNRSALASEAFQAMQSVFEGCLDYVRRGERRRNEEEEGGGRPVPPPPNVFSQEDETPQERHAPGHNRSHPFPPPPPPPPAPFSQRRHERTWAEKNAAKAAAAAAYPPPPPPPMPKAPAKVPPPGGEEHVTVDGDDDDDLFDIPLPPDVFATAAGESGTTPQAERHAHPAGFGGDHAHQPAEISLDELPSLSVSGGESEVEAPAVAARTTRKPTSAAFRSAPPPASSSPSSSSSHSFSPSADGNATGAPGSAKVKGKRTHHGTYRRSKQVSGPAPRHGPTNPPPSLSQVLAAFDISLSSSCSDDEDYDTVERLDTTRGRSSGRAKANVATRPPPPHILSASFTPCLPDSRDTANNDTGAVYATAMMAAAAQRRRERVGAKGSGRRRKGGTGHGEGTEEGEPWPPQQQRCSCGRACKGMCFLCE